LTLLDRFRMDDRVVVITGASSGLGRGFAQAFAEAGAHVVLGARREQPLAAVAEELRAAGHRVATRVTNVADPDACTALVEAGREEFGRIDSLINNAGIGTAVPALRETPEQFRSVLDVNLHGAYWMAQACGRVMEPGSSIVNIASVLALIKSNLPQAAYASSKAAIVGLTRDLSQQWSGRRGIRVNAVAPGYFASEMTDSLPPGELDHVASATDLHRIGEQPELDAAVLFLASDAASYITGITLAVDGGMSGH
jgi:NAD(P)-dependent dehydrogenase (short-subunit alcohol dehydrogenase family)